MAKGTDHPHSFRHFLRQHWFLVVWIVATYLLGLAGYSRYAREHGNPMVWGSFCYDSLLLFLLKIPHLDPPINWLLEAARWSGVGVCWRVGMGFAGSLMHRDLFGWWHRRHSRVVLCGGGAQGVALLRSVRQKGLPLAVIDEAGEGILSSEALELGCAVVRGSPDDVATWNWIGLQTATRLIIACETDAGSVRALNCALEVARVARSGQKPLPCDVQLGDMDMRRAIANSWSEGGTATFPLQVKFSDPFAISARRLLLEIMPLDRGGVEKKDVRQVHLVVLGFGRMGRAVAMQAAQLGQFANGKPLKITVLDRRASQHEQELLFRCREFRRAADIVFHEQEACSEATWLLLEGAVHAPDTITNIAICYDNDQLALEIALRLRPLTDGTRTPLGVRFRANHGLAEALAVLSGDTDAPPSLVRAFGTLEESCRIEAFDDPFIDELALRLHEVHVTNAEAQGRDRTKEALLHDWDKLPEKNKQSSRQLAEHLQIKLGAVGRELAMAGDPREEAVFRPEEIDELAELEHTRWCAERWLGGWTFAPGKRNLILMTHPDLIPWSNLAANLKDYDIKLVKAIPGLLVKMGRKLVRKKR